MRCIGLSREQIGINKREGVRGKMSIQRSVKNESRGSETSGMAGRRVNEIRNN
jgi:hypothetical protein